MSIETDWQLIRNRFHTYGNPISVAKMERALDLLVLPRGARVLDVGCGKGELLIRLVERFGAAAVGIDPSTVLSMARANAAARIPDADVTWHSAKRDDVPLEPGSFDLTACIGSLHAFGELDDALTALVALTRPGGYVLVADGVRLQTPPPEYLAAIGADDTELPRDNAQNIAAGRAHGLRALWTALSSRDEWDEFEWLYMYAMERHAEEHGLTPEQEEQLVATREFQDAQQRWGRDTMGFGLYLFQVPAG